MPPVYRPKLSERMRARTPDYDDGLISAAEELEARADQAGRGERELRASLTVYEPPIYGAGGNSYFQDIARAQFGSQVGASEKRIQDAKDRLRRYEVAAHRETERRLRELRGEAEYATERALSRTRAETALLHRWQAAGGHLFEREREMRELEKRALNRVQGSGGYFAPPAFLVDQFIHAPRAGMPFASLWQRLPMPTGTQSINLPRFKTGAGSNAMLDGAGVPNRDPADSQLTVSLVTIAAQVDTSLQWLEQTPVNVDETLGADLAEDFAIQIDGQLLLGSGSAPQAQGVIPGGVLSAANSIWLSNTNNQSGQTWSNSSGDPGSTEWSIHQFTAMLASKIGTYRGLAPTAYVMNLQAWSIYSGSADNQNRPLNPETPTRQLHNIPVVIDQNIPNTFGSSTAPTIGLSNGITSPTDGNGTWTPILAGRWQDCIYWQSEPVIRVLLETLAGTLQARFQVRTYIAAAPDRVVWGGSNQSFSGGNQAGGVNAGAAVAYGALSQYTANGILQPTSLGF